MGISVKEMINSLKITNTELDTNIAIRKELLGCAKRDYCGYCNNKCKSELPIRNKKSKILIVNDFSDNYTTYELIAKISLALNSDYTNFSYISLMQNAPGITKDDFVSCSALAITNELNILKPDIVIGLGSSTTKMLQKLLENNYKIKRGEEVIIAPSNMISDYSFKYIETVSTNDLINDFDHYKNTLANDLYKVLKQSLKVA